MTNYSRKSFKIYYSYYESQFSVIALKLLTNGVYCDVSMDRARVHTRPPRRLITLPPRDLSLLILVSADHLVDQYSSFSKFRGYFEIQVPG